MWAHVSIRYSGLQFIAQRSGLWTSTPSCGHAVPILIMLPSEMAGMDDTGVVGVSPAVRVAVGSGTPAARDCLDSARESASAAAVTAVGLTGITTLAPLVLATRDGETAFHANCSHSGRQR
jgi:hypothetical protein